MIKRRQCQIFTNTHSILAQLSFSLLGKGIKAISQGLDEGLNTSTVFIDESLNKDGVMIKLARIDDEELNNIALNLLFNDGFSNELTLVAYDNNGNKVESVTKNVIALKGSEKTEAFEFQNRDAIDIAYCILKK